MSRCVVLPALLLPAFISLASGNQAITGPCRGFTENKGQIVDQNDKPNPKVLYLLNTPGMNVQLRKGGFSYDVYQTEKSEEISQHSLDSLPGRFSQLRHLATSLLNFHRIDFDFIGSNQDCGIIVSGKSPEYSNYYTTGTPLEGVTHVHAYQSVIYKNLYPGIDVEFATDEARGFKYNIVVHPGGDLASVKMKIRGPVIDLTPEGALKLKNTLGTIEETIPQSHFVTSSGKIEAKARFIRTGRSVYGFSAETQIPAGATLVIDPIPTRIWGTYLGGNQMDELDDGILGPDHYLYVAGYTMSTLNLATAGAYQTTFSGIRDAYMGRLTTSGTRLWCTYYGGPLLDEAQRIAPDNNGNLYITGLTESASGIASPGAFQDVFGGVRDGFLIKLDTSGQRLWATYYGGSGDDEMSGVVTDSQGNIYAVGFTASDNNIATPGSFQPSRSGNEDAFVVCFNSAGQRLWGTYYGGSYNDEGYDIKFDNQGQLVFTGTTTSANNIATPGSFQSSIGNSPGGSTRDDFLCRFTTGGNRTWATYYGGTGDERAGRLCTTPDGYLFMTGVTASTDNIASPGSYQTTYGGLTDSYFAKFDLSGNRIFASYYGGSGSEWFPVIMVDDSSNIFIGGATASFNNISTSNGFQTVKIATYGTPNGFLVKFNPAGNRVWGTYYGGYYQTWIQSIACTGDTLFAIGSTSSDTYIATPGAFQTTLSGAGDGYLVRFIDCMMPGPVGQISGPTSICMGATGVVFSVSPVQNATGYLWELPPGATIVSGQNTTTITVNFSSGAVSGNISVTGVNVCGTDDPKTIAITILPAPAPSILGSSSVILGNTYTYTTEPGMTNYIWNIPAGTVVGGGGNSNNWVQVQWNTLASTWISVSYTAVNGCSSSTSSFNISVINGATVNFTAPDTVCTGGTVNIANLSVGATTYYWSFCSGNTLSNPLGVNIGNPGNLLNIPGYMTLVKHNDTCFSFVTNQGSMSLVRYNHGTSFNNNPVSWTNLGGFGFLGDTVMGIKILNDNGTWIGILNNNNRLVRLNFGPSPGCTPTAQQLGPYPMLYTAHGLDIIHENNTWIGYLTCSWGNKLVRLNFGDHLTNNPVLTDLGLPGSMNMPGPFRIINENGTWYALVVNGGNNTLTRLNFGNSLLNDPTGVNIGTPCSGIVAPGGIALIRDCETTTGFQLNYSTTSPDLIWRLTFPTGITGTVSGTSLGNIGSMSRPNQFSELFRVGDTMFLYNSNRANFTMTRLRFLPCTNASVPSSTLITPPPYSYNQTGTYNIQLILNEGLPDQVGLCKDIVVMPPPVVNLGSDKSICPGTSATLDAGASFTGYLWSTGATTRTITVLTAGNYSVTATRWGCNASDAVNVTMLPAPAVALGPDQAVCSGQAATFDAGACTGCTYQWSNLTTSQPIVGNGQTYTTGTAGTYVVTVTNANGCIGKDTIQLTVTPALPVSVSISASPPGAVCAGTNVLYAASVVNAGSSPAYQWKVNAGNVSNATSSTFNYVPANGDCITCVVTSGASCATGNPATSNQICMTVNQNLPVSANITASANPVCAGTPVTCSANAVNPGSSPAYQWKVNAGNATNATNSSFTYQPVNGDQVSCVVTSSEACTTGNPATSTPATMTVNPLLPVSITVTGPANPVCAGNPVTFSTYAGNPGNMPAYQWKINGSNVTSATNASFTCVPVNGDMVSCTLASSESCTVGNPATSAPITMTVNPNMPVSLTISASANPFCTGSAVTFTANAVNAGSTPVYQWKKNGVNAGPATGSSYTFIPVGGDIISCFLTSSVTCPTGNPATSNALTMAATPLLPAGVTISASANPFCAGTPVTFTASPVNGGTAPTYQWKVNAINAGNATHASYAYHANNGDLVTCVMTSNLNCVSSNPATSPSITMIARALPEVSFTPCFDTVTYLNAKPYRLKGGLPAGGQYTGPGVNSATGFFAPSSAGTGLKTITYGYTNVYTCMSAATKTILVKPTPAFTCGGTFTDPRDNHVYSTVLIGSQCWLNENLNYGTEIPYTTSQTDNCLSEKYIRNQSSVISNPAYQWDELMCYETSAGSQGLCPPGWHVPTAAEWEVLLNYYNGPGITGVFLKNILLANGFDSYQYGFLYQNNLWSFTGGDYAGSMYWTSTLTGDSRAVARGVNDYNFSVSRYEAARSNAFNVRCVKE